MKSTASNAWPPNENDASPHIGRVSHGTMPYMTPAADSAVLDSPVLASPADTATSTVESDLLLEDLLVEEISIDGMCGVY